MVISAIGIRCRFILTSILSCRCSLFALFICFITHTHTEPAVHGTVKGFTSCCGKNSIHRCRVKKHGRSVSLAMARYIISKRRDVWHNLIWAKEVHHKEQIDFWHTLKNRQEWRARMYFMFFQIIIGDRHHFFGVQQQLTRLVARKYSGYFFLPSSLPAWPRPVATADAQVGVAQMWGIALAACQLGFSGMCA